MPYTMQPGRRCILSKWLNNNIVKRIIIFLLVILAASACSKEGNTPSIPPVKQCNDRLYASPLPADTCLYFPDGPVLYFYHRVGLGYALIGRNPEHSDEWIYLINREEGSTGNEGSEIWKVDTCSGRKQKLTDHAYIQPKLNQNGWILFMNRQDGLLYKVNTQGDSLAVVSQEVNNITFDWCLNGEAFFYRARFKDMAYLVDINGSVLDSFAMDCHAIAGRGNRIALSLYNNTTFNHTRIAILNLTDRTLTEVVEVGGTDIQEPLALAWESDNTLIWAISRGLYRLHVSTGVIEPIKETCENVFYYYPVVERGASPWLILGKRDYSWPVLANIDFTTNMVLYNTDTGEEWKLDLDQ